MYDKLYDDYDNKCILDINKSYPELDCKNLSRVQTINVGYGFHPGVLWDIPRSRFWTILCGLIISNYLTMIPISVKGFDC